MYFYFRIKKQNYCFQIVYLNLEVNLEVKSDKNQMLLLNVKNNTKGHKSTMYTSYFS